MNNKLLHRILIIKEIIFAILLITLGIINSFFITSALEQFHAIISSCVLTLSGLLMFLSSIMWLKKSRYYYQLLITSTFLWCLYCIYFFSPVDERFKKELIIFINVKFIFLIFFFYSFILLLLPSFRTFIKQYSNHQNIKINLILLGIFIVVIGSPLFLLFLHKSGRYVECRNYEIYIEEKISNESIITKIDVLRSRKVLNNDDAIYLKFNCYISSIAKMEINNNPWRLNNSKHREINSNSNLINEGKIILSDGDIIYFNLGASGKSVIKLKPRKINWIKIIVKQSSNKIQSDTYLMPTIKIYKIIPYFREIPKKYISLCEENC